MKYLLLSFFCFTHIFLRAQDLYDYAHSKKYAEYLLKTERYDLYSQEMERLLFLRPQNDTLKIGLVQSYKLAGKYSIAIKKTESFFDVANGKDTISEFYIRLLLVDHQYSKADSFLTRVSWEENKKLQYSIASSLLQKKWAQAKKLNTESKIDFYIPVFEAIDKSKRKSPLLSLAMSAVIPGSGKLYCRRGKDGFVSLFTIGIFTWQSYTGFHKKGIESIYGWVNGAFAAGFYAGNLYGSVKAAHDFNKAQDDIILEKVKSVTVYTY